MREVVGRAGVCPILATLRNPGIAHDVGDGIGYEFSFTIFEWMVPLFEQCDQSLTFADLRMLLNNAASVAGGSIFDANGTDANITGTLSINGAPVFPQRGRTTALEETDRRLAEASERMSWP